MPTISQLLQYILSKRYGEEVRGAIHDAIEKCYQDVNSATLREDAFQAALQAAIDHGDIPGMVIADNSISGAKIQDGTIPLRKLSEAVQITVDSALSDSSTNPVQNKVIKGAIDELNGSLENFIYDGEPNYITGWKTGYIATNGSTVNINSVVSNAQYEYVILDVVSGDKYRIYIANDGGVARGYCIIDIDGNVLMVSNGDGKTIDTDITIPENAVKLIVNRRAERNDHIYKINVILDELQEHENEITVLQKNPIFRTENTYNLMDYETDMLWGKNIINDGKITDSPSQHWCGKFIPVSQGDIIGSDKRIRIIHKYDADKQYLSSYSNPSLSNMIYIRITEADVAFIRVGFSAKEYTNKDIDPASHEPICIYKVTTTTRYSDRKPAIPERQIDGRYVSKDIYHVSIPDIDSEFYRRMTMRSIKRENKEKGAIRIGSFNIFGAMLQPQANWWVVKKEVMEYGLNICGFQEVGNGTLEDDGVTQRFSFTEVMTGEQFPYSDLSVGNELNAAQRIISDCEITTGEYVPYTLTVNNTTKTFGYDHCIMNLPNYHHARAWNKQLSMYACHFSTTGSEARAMIAHMLEVLEADTTEYKVLVADTNCFRLGDDGRPWCWALLEAGGLYPSLTDFTKSSYRDPITQEQYNNGELDMIDNVFISSNMKCINWNIVDSRDYPIPGVSGGAVSDHCMVYADVIFDYVDGFEDA